MDLVCSSISTWPKLSAHYKLNSSASYIYANTTTVVEFSGIDSNDHWLALAWKWPTILWQLSLADFSFGLQVLEAMCMLVASVQSWVFASPHHSWSSPPVRHFPLAVWVPWAAFCVQWSNFTCSQSIHQLLSKLCLMYIRKKFEGVCPDFLLH